MTSACDPLRYEPAGRPFDVITAIDVFEHLLTPKEHLAAFRKLLVPGGMIVLEMPDVDQGGLRRLGYEWKHFKPREHAYFYGSDHVRRLAAATALTVEGSFVPYPDRRVHLLRRSA